MSEREISSGDEMHDNFRNSRAAFKDLGVAYATILESEKKRRVGLITTHITQTTPEIGIFGVSVEAENGSLYPVQTIINTYKSREVREKVYKQNNDHSQKERDYFDGTSEELGLSKPAVEAAVYYYQSHKGAFDAQETYFQATERETR